MDKKAKILEEIKGLLKLETCNGEDDYCEISKPAPMYKLFTEEEGKKEESLISFSDITD